jgi:hypothetical protein
MWTLPSTRLSKESNTMTDEDSEALSASEAYDNKIRDGNLPVPTGNLVKEFEIILVREQRELATLVFHYLANDNSNLTQLNAEHRLYTALLNIPNSNNINIIYGLGFGSSLLSFLVESSI